MADLALLTPLAAQDVTVGEPGWFSPEGAPDQPPKAKQKHHVACPDELATSDETSYVILARYLDSGGQGWMMEGHTTQPWLLRAFYEAVGNGWEMAPARLNGKPVASWFWIPIILNPKSASPDRPDAKPRLLAVAPVIMPEAMLIKLRGNDVAWGSVRLDVAGEPLTLTMEPGFSDRLRPYVETALKQWRFAPARKGGQAVPADVRVAFHFFPPMAPVPTQITPPRAVRQVPPIYPFVLRRSGIDGEVLVAFVVDAKGKVVNAIALRSNSPDFNQLAVDAVLKWKFKPATVDGRPVRTRVTVPIVFNLTEGDGQSEVRVESPSRRDQEQMPEEIRYDVAPKLRGMVPPVYPYALLRAGTKGKATVLYQVDTKGRVVGLKIAEATHPEFGLALGAAVEIYRFDPALKDGKPTSTVIKSEQDFDPSDLLSPEDRILLRYEEKKPASIVGADKLDKPLRPLLPQSPVFPVALRGKVDRGEAQIEVLVDDDGHARLPRIVKASDPAFGYAAVQALSQWLFEPPKSGGKPAVVRVIVPFKFATEPPVMGTAVGEPTAPGAAKPNQEKTP